jgi:hypothetical protein
LDQNIVFTIIVKTVGIWILAQYLIGPWLVLFQVTAPERFVLPKLEWTELLMKLGKQLSDAHEVIIGLGYVPCGATEVPNIKAISYVHPIDGSGIQLRHLAIGYSVCFSQWYSGGMCLLVSNSQLPEVFPAWHKRTSYLLPRCRDIPALFDKFKRIRSALNIEGAVKADARIELQATEEFLNAELQENVRNGFYAKKVSDGKRRLSVKGAFVISWRIAWPSKPIMLALAQKRAENAAG